MLVFHDLEFTGLDKAKPDLISIAFADEAGRDVCAELPEVHWTVQCNESVHVDVLPHWWRGEYVQREATTRRRITPWRESSADEKVIVTNCTEVDFFGQLQRLLPQWSQNLHRWPFPFPFPVWSMGGEMPPVLHKRLDEYRTSDRPPRHALHHAHAPRLGLSPAPFTRWCPGEEAL